MILENQYSREIIQNSKLIECCLFRVGFIHGNVLVAISIAVHLFKHQIKQNAFPLDNAFSKCKVQTLHCVPLHSEFNIIYLSQEIKFL